MEPQQPGELGKVPMAVRQSTSSEIHDLILPFGHQDPLQSGHKILPNPEQLDRKNLRNNIFYLCCSHRGTLSKSLHDLPQSPSRGVVSKSLGSMWLSSPPSVWSTLGLRPSQNHAVTNPRHLQLKHAIQKGAENMQQDSSMLQRSCCQLKRHFSSRGVSMFPIRSLFSLHVTLH